MPPEAGPAGRSAEPWSARPWPAPFWRFPGASPPWSRGTAAVACGTLGWPRPQRYGIDKGR